MDLYFFETPNARKPCALARHLQLDVTYRRIDLTRGQQKSAPFLSINPNGRVPALVDGDVRMWESHAMMIYLAQKAGSDLWPAEPVRQADVVRWLVWDSTHFSRHAGRLFWEHHVKPAFGLGQADPSEVSDAHAHFQVFAKVLDGHLDGREHIVDGGLTVADFGVAAFLPTAAEAQLSLDSYPQIRRWHDAMMQIPAWRQPWPPVPQAA